MFDDGGQYPLENRKANLRQVKLIKRINQAIKFFDKIVIFCLQFNLVVVISQVLARLLTMF